MNGENAQRRKVYLYLSIAHVVIVAGWIWLAVVAYSWAWVFAAVFAATGIGLTVMWWRALREQARLGRDRDCAVG